MRFEPAAEVRHVGGASSGAGETQAIAARSRVCYARKHRRRRAARLEALGVALDEATHALSSARAAPRRGHAAALRPRSNAVRPRQMRQALLRALRRLFPKLMHKRALSHDEWSEIEEDLLPAVVDPSRAAVDVGAHVGSYTVRLARIVPRVFAFEPDVDLAGLLQRAAPRNVLVSSDALSDTAGWKTFRVPVEAGHASVTLGSLADLSLHPRLTARSDKHARRARGRGHRVHQDRRRRS